MTLQIGRFANRPYRNGRFAFLLLLAALLLLPRAGAAAQGNPALLRGDGRVLAVGETVDVPILLENAYEVYALEVRLRFDPALLEIVDTDTTKPGVQMLPGDFPKPEFLGTNDADPATGLIRYVITQLNPTLPASGSGVVFTVRLRARANGEMPLRFELAELANRDGLLLEVTTQDVALSATGGAPGVTPGAGLAAPDTPVPGGANAAATATAVPAAGSTAQPAAGATTVPAAANTAVIAPSPLPAAGGATAPAEAPADAAAPVAAGAAVQTPAGAPAAEDAAAAAPAAAAEEVVAAVAVEAGAETAVVGGAEGAAESAAPAATAAAPVAIGGAAPQQATAVPAAAPPSAAAEDGGNNAAVLLLIALLAFAAGALGLLLVLSRRARQG